MRPSVRVHEVADQIRGVTYVKSEARNRPEEGYLPILRAGNIKDDGITYSDLVFVPTNRIGPHQRIRKNDVLIAASSGSLSVVGKSGRAVQEFEGGFGAFCKVLRPSPRVDPSYFAHYFRTSSYRRKISALAEGANINNLRGEHLDNLEIPLPPIEEQRRIAAILDQADALRSKRREALSLLDDLTQSVFIDMFGDPRLNPRGWPKRQLKDLGLITTGRTPPGTLEGMFGADVPFMTPGDLGTRLPAKRWLTAAGATKSKVVRSGATLVCCIGATIGKVGSVEAESAFNQQINAVEWGESVNDAFGSTTMRWMRTEIAASGASTTLPLFKKSDFERFTIPLPPRGMQDAFAAQAAMVKLSRADMVIGFEAVDRLFMCLQQRAFSGRL